MTTETPVEIQALSVEEAIIVGLTRLALTREEVEIEILDEGSKGFLGLGTRPARVRLTPRSGEPLSSQPVAGPADEPVPAEIEPPAPQSAEAAPSLPPLPEPKPEPQPAAPSSLVAVIHTLPTPAREEAPAQPNTAVGVPAQPTPELDRVAVAQAALDITRHLLPGLRIELETQWEEDEQQPTLYISVNGRDANALVGPQGLSLDATQYLVRMLLHRQAPGSFSVVVDADGFRLRRRRNLETLAHEKADQAAQTGRTIQLRPMPADERRVIHIALRDDPRVMTESIGRGSDRAVTIIPKKH